MSTASIEIYNALVQAGIDKDKAKQVADDLVTRADTQHFATKEDVTALEGHLQRFIFTALVTQAVFVVGTTITLIQLFA